MPSNVIMPLSISHHYGGQSPRAPNRWESPLASTTTTRPRRTNSRGRIVVPQAVGFGINDRFLLCLGTLLAILGVFLCIGSLTSPRWIEEQQKGARLFKSANMWSVCFNFGHLKRLPAKAQLRLIAFHFNLTAPPANGSGGVIVERPPTWGLSDCCNLLWDRRCTYLWHFVQHEGFTMYFTLFCIGIGFSFCSIVTVFTLHLPDDNSPELRLLEVLRNFHSAAMFFATASTALALTGFVHNTGDSRRSWVPKVPYTTYSGSFYLALSGTFVVFVASCVIWLDHLILSFQIWDALRCELQNDYPELELSTIGTPTSVSHDHSSDDALADDPPPSYEEAILMFDCQLEIGRYYPINNTVAAAELPREEATN